MAESDVSRDALEKVEKITQAERGSAEDLPESEEMKRQPRK